MEPVAIIFGLACCGSMAAAHRSRSGAAQVCALLMLGLWAAANLLALLETPDFHPLDWLALLDLPIAVLTFVAWFELRRAWLLVVAVCFAERLVLHVFAATGALEWVTYVHTINALFLAALLAISWKGNVDALVAHLGDRFVRRAGRRLASLAHAVAKVATR